MDKIKRALLNLERVVFQRTVSACGIDVHRYSGQRWLGRWMILGFLVWLTPADLLAQNLPRINVQPGGAIIQQLPAEQLQMQEALREMMQRRRLQNVDEQVEVQPDGEVVAQDTSEKFPYGASLSTNADVAALMEKANRYLQEGNYRTAGRFWQAAMKSAGDALYSEDDEFYFPLVRKIESEIANLPAEGLEVYRVSADADAAGFLAEGPEGSPNREVALQKVVDFAFLSSQGDDAALELATYYLDRFEVFSADTLLHRILDSYPDPSVPLDEVWTKLAVTRTLQGDQGGAREALLKARQLQQESGNVAVDASLLDRVESMVQNQTETKYVASSSDGNWRSPLGLGTEIEEAPGLPMDYLSGPLAPAWMYQQQLREWNLGPRDSHIKGDVQRNPLQRSDFRDAAYNAVPEGQEKMRADATRGSVEREWQNNAWQSASLPLVVDGKVIFKSQADVGVWSTQLKQEPVFRSLWLNRYSTDPVQQQLLNQTRTIQNSFPGSNMLKFHNLETMQFFGDRLFQSMTCYNGVLYSIEGERYNRDERMPSIIGRPQNIWSAAPTRDRSCVLNAYELSTGKALWDQPFPPTDPTSEFKEGAILGPPVGYHDVLLTPVLAAGRYFVVALEARTGKLRWKQMICDSPSLSTSALTMVQLALSGSDLYMTCGCGVLARVNAGTGQLAWVRRYQRSVDETQNQNQAVFGLNREWLNKEVRGWNHDLVFVWGSWVVMAASDRNQLMGFDRGSGEFVWMAPRENVLGVSVDSWLGVRDGIMYAVGDNGLLAYELAAEGRLYGTPQRLDRPVTGRGLLLDEGVILPMGEQISRFDLKSLQRMSDTKVILPGNAQLGTLVSDGSRLWSAAMGMLLALEPITGQDDLQESESESSETDSAEGSAEAVSTMRETAAEPIELISRKVQ